MYSYAETIFHRGILLEKEVHFKQAKAVYEDILQHVSTKNAGMISPPPRAIFLSVSIFFMVILYPTP